jgi:hypothetical protein
MKPYKDLEITPECIIREFGQNIDPIELMWHRDNEQRLIEIINPGQNWKFQFEDELPWDLESKMSFVILKHKWHRIIKGKENLLIKIHKFKEE